MTRLLELFESLQKRYESVGDSYRVKRHYLKIRFSDFTHTAVERELSGGITLDGYRGLCEQSVRLIGIGLHFMESTTDQDNHQYSLAFDSDSQSDIDE